MTLAANYDADMTFRSGCLQILNGYHLADRSRFREQLRLRGANEANPAKHRRLLGLGPQHAIPIALLACAGMALMMVPWQIVK